MATKSKEVYCSVILTNNMEYMVRVPSDVSLWGIDKGVLIAKTIDGKSIAFPTQSAMIYREVSDEEYEVWKKSLEQYREEQLKKAQVSNLSTN